MTFRPPAAATVAVTAWLLLASTTARAQVEATLEVVAPPADARPDAPPLLRARVTGAASGLTAADFVLEDPAARPPVRVTAARAVTYRESDQPMTLVILVQGTYRWMGNEQSHDPEDPEQGRYDGAHAGLRPAIEALAQAGPAGSRAALLTYGGDGVIERAPLADAAQLDGAALGGQNAYTELVGTPLATGLHRALAVLGGAGPARRILVVIGDGRDSRSDPDELKLAGRALGAAGVEVYAIHFDNIDKDAVEGRRNMRALGAAGDFSATSRNDLGPLAGTVAARIGARYDIDFSAGDLPCDGGLHDLGVTAHGLQAEPAAVRLPLWRKPAPARGRSWWWLWLLPAPILVGGVLWLRGRQAAAEPAPLPPVEEATAAAVFAPAPAPARTMMLDLGGGEDAMPVVGWIVPLGGPRQYQTFKLQPAGTTLGTGGESHVVVPDHFMSTEHARIQFASGSFVLSDNGSTNGVYVNSHKVSRHELVDNDLFLLGQTEFKFKSIN